MQQQLKEVGIDMSIKQVEVGVWFNAFVKGDYQITSAYQERTDRSRQLLRARDPHRRRDQHDPATRTRRPTS
jgi:hypothetical protein